MKLIEELKSHSSKWIKTIGVGYKNFYWQDGYGAFSVNSSEKILLLLTLPTNTNITVREQF